MNVLHSQVPLREPERQNRLTQTWTFSLFSAFFTNDADFLVFVSLIDDCSSGKKSWLPVFLMTWPHVVYIWLDTHKGKKPAQCQEGSHHSRVLTLWWDFSFTVLEVCFFCSSVTLLLNVPLCSSRPANWTCLWLCNSVLFTIFFWKWKKRKKKNYWVKYH